MTDFHPDLALVARLLPRFDGLRRVSVAKAFRASQVAALRRALAGRDGIAP